MALTAQQQAVLARPEWQSDEQAGFCNRCEEIFSFFLRKHHCRNCGMVFCYNCTPNTFDLPPEWGYSGPQRVCIDCFFKLAKEQELKTSTKDELMILQFFLRDSQVYRMRSRDVYDMGTRTAPEKTPACAEFLDKQDSKSDHIATLISTEHAPQSLSSAQTKKNWERVLYSLDHPFLLPVLEADTLLDRNRVVLFRPYCSKGSLRDLIYRVSDPKNPSRKKYPLKVPFKEYDDLLGMPESIEDEKCYSDLKESFIKESCRQILEGLLYLQRSRVPYPHLHTGNVMVQKKRCCLSDFENITCGLKPFYTLTLRNTAPEVECFGNVLYEMTMGFPRCPHILDPSKNLVHPKTCPTDISEVLQAIFLGGETPMTLELLLELPIFADVKLKNQEAIPTKMKGMTKGMAAYLQELRNASDKQLQENFEKQTERVAELASQRAQKEEERKAKNEQQSTRAQLAAQGVLGESEHAYSKGRRPGEQARRALSPSRSNAEHDLAEDGRRKRKKKSKTGSNSSVATSAAPTSPPTTPSPAPTSPTPAPSAPPPAPTPPPAPSAPPPPSGGPPPPKPPPPGPPPSTSSAPPPASSGRNALLDSIRNPGKSLKKTTTVDKSVPKHLR